MPATLAPSAPRSPAPKFPRGVLLFGAVLLAGAIAAAAIGRAVGPATYPPEGTALAARALAFADEADGAVSVREAGREAPIARIEPGTGAFIRATLRGLVRARRLDGHGADPAFLLTAWSDGRLTLQDQATGRMIDINAFGPTQVEAFARLLTAKGFAP
jgi:putative photosynthetic complex assembly protein